MIRVFYYTDTGEIQQSMNAPNMEPRELDPGISWVDVEDIDMTALSQYLIVDGQVVAKPNIDELQAERMWSEVRLIRDRILMQTDWTENPSVQALHTDAWRTAWAAYRQALRDITEQDINNIVWPTPPDIAN